MTERIHAQNATGRLRAWGQAVIGWRPVIPMSVATSAGLFVGAARPWVPIALGVAGAVAGYALDGRRQRPKRPGLAVPAQLPPLQTVFCGRQDELSALHRAHSALRERIGSAGERAGSRTGPIVVRLNGQPGVGKSALAQVFAHEIMTVYPDGQLYTNLGNVGSMRPPATILREFLEALGYRDAIPDDATESAKLFRSLTADLDLLVVLDAAGGAEQVFQVMPTGPRCTVIVTSRRDLGVLSASSFSMTVPLPPFNAALEMLRAFTWSEPTHEPLAAVEIVELCGRLPIALRAIGDQTGHGERPRLLGSLAARLRKEAGRMAVLGDGERSPEDKLNAEYDRLAPGEQLALERLAWVKTTTFVPWVLIPLLDLKYDNTTQREAESVLSRLASAQLLEITGEDPAFGVNRFRFHPLVKLFVMTRAAGRGDSGNEAERRAAQRWAAQRRVTEACLVIADRVLPLLDRPATYRVVNPLDGDRWFPPEGRLYRRIADNRAFWIRNEYVTLVDCARLALDLGHRSLARRLAALLRDPVPGEVKGTMLIQLFDSVIGDPEQPFGRHPREDLEDLNVLLAKGSALLALGRHTQARDLLESLTLRANLLSSDSRTARRARPLEHEAFRRLGEVHLRGGAHADAERELLRAKEIALGIGDRSTAARVAVADAMLGAISRPQRTGSGTPAKRDDSEWAFWARLAEADRAPHDADGRERLREVEQRYDGEGGRVAMALFRLARWHLRNADIPEAVRDAARACVGYEKLDDRYGNVRALCLLAIAHVRAGEPVQAARILGQAEKKFKKLDAAARHRRAPLSGWIQRARAEWDAGAGNDVDAVLWLRLAVKVFFEHGDRQSLAEMAGLIERYRLLETPDPQLESRRFEAWLELDGKAQVGRPLAACFAVDEAPAPVLSSLERPGPGFGGGMIRVEVEAEGARAEPKSHLARLDPIQPLRELRFTVTPTTAGDLRVRFRVYGARNGHLLQEFTAPAQPVLDVGGQGDGRNRY